MKKYLFFIILFLLAGCTDQKKAHQQDIFKEKDFLESQVITAEKESNKEVVDDVEIQAVSFMVEIAFEMSVAMLASMGASMANSHITSQAQLLATKISKGSQTIQNNIQAFMTKAQQKQQQKLQAMMTAFSNAYKDVQEKNQQASAISSLELDYLYKSISLEQPQQNYIFNQIQFDQLFALGTMLTPQGPLWKNPFSVGDWEYEQASNSFWQYQSSPMFHENTDDAGKVTTSCLQAENNAIYAEYFTTKQSYTIAGTILLNKVDFPFFTGIIFNKSRWISGDFEAIRKCRMIGMYGTSPTDIGIYFAQQFTMNDEQLKANPGDSPIQTPLQQIINNKAKKQINLPSEAFTNLPNSPRAFNYEITNSPTQVDFKFWINDAQPMTITINNLDPEIYMYHGIGFICPGAVAEFTLTQPQNFIFTPQALSSYKE